MKKISLKIGTVLMATTMLLAVSCKKDDVDPVVPVPEVENDEEVITDVKLIFTNSSDATDIVEALAQDPDGSGVQELQILDTINLDVNKTYVLTYEILNSLESPAGDIAEEIDEEGEEHQIFYAFSNDAFANPMGDGNIDNASDALNYNDLDNSGNPIGLNTTWTTSATATSLGSFTIRLQHQPDIKTSTTGANDGDTDLDLTFVLDIQ